MEDKYVDKFRDLPQGDLTAYYRFLNELGDRFHASHHLVMRMAQFLVLLQGKRLESLPRERIETQSMLCDKLLSYVSRFVKYFSKIFHLTKFFAGWIQEQHKLEPNFCWKRTKLI